MARDVNEILEQAIYGSPETKPGERKVFLTTILERVHLALTKNQVRAKMIYEEAERILKTKSNLHVYLNAELGYGAYSDYIRLLSTYNVTYTIVTSTGDTPFGLVIADKDKAIFADSPYVIDDVHKQDIEAY